MGNSSSNQQHTDSPIMRTVKVEKKANGVRFVEYRSGEYACQWSGHLRNEILEAALAVRAATSITQELQKEEEGLNCSTIFSQYLPWSSSNQNEIKEELKEEEKQENKELNLPAGYDSITANGQFGRFTTLFSPAWSMNDLRLETDDWLFELKYRCFVIGNAPISDQEECKRIYETAMGLSQNGLDAQDPPEIEVICNYEAMLEWLNAKEEDVQRAIDALEALPNTNVEIE